jgi:hypothetical protein
VKSTCLGSTRERIKTGTISSSKRESRLRNRDARSVVPRSG